jgi:hypothetical protein
MSSLLFLGGTMAAAGTCTPEVAAAIERAGLVAGVTAELEAWKEKQCGGGDCCTPGRGCYDYQLLPPDCFPNAEVFTGGRMVSVAVARQRFQDTGRMVVREVFVADDGSAFALVPGTNHRHLLAMQAVTDAFVPVDGEEITAAYRWSASAGCTEVTPQPGSVFAGRLRICGDAVDWLEGPVPPPVPWRDARDAAVAELGRYPGFRPGDLPEAPSGWGGANTPSSLLMTVGERSFYVFGIFGHHEMAMSTVVVRIDTQTGAIGSTLSRGLNRRDLAGAAADLQERPAYLGLEERPAPRAAQPGSSGCSCAAAPGAAGWWPALLLLCRTPGTLGRALGLRASGSARSPRTTARPG